MCSRTYISFKVVLLSFFLIYLIAPNSVNANNFSSISEDSLKVKIADEISGYLKPFASINVKAKIESIERNKNVLKIFMNNTLSDYYFRDDIVDNIYNIVGRYFPNKKIMIYANNSLLEDLKSGFYSGKKIRAKSKSKKVQDGVLVKNLSNPYNITKGLDGRHIALWQSHGYYYDQSLQRWEWQRARIFQTVEDLYTQSYVLPFLVPMLENAGANVLLPRERDSQINEVIVDNDTPLSGYTEVSGTNMWISNEFGFANPKPFYDDGENPFKMGTYRTVNVIKESDLKKKGSLKESVAEWVPNIPEKGEYTVYISYKTLPTSTPAAEYTVKYSGGEKKFLVNQQMGGGTWIYLGTFMFDKDNSSQGVTLSNIYNGQSSRKRAKYVVSADGVKFGGGMGNIARHPSYKPITKIIDYNVAPEVSGYPRFTEGARYWLQWAGFADTVYSYSNLKNDYNDDYMSRGRWVNALLGGSSKNPSVEGYNIPIDMAFAFHTDAGTFLNDSIVGTLAIYTKISNESDKYANGESRMLGRELADIVQTQLVNDVRAQFEPSWSRRGLWDRSYAESRTPEVPTMLLEFLSHQNFADMKYGLDPSFRFTVSRAIYKGILKFLSYKNGIDYVIQPLPVKNFSVTFADNESDTKGGRYLRLSWSPQRDTLEINADAKQYIIYKRVGDSGFDNGLVVNDTTTLIKINPNEVYGFKVVAMNEGGVSFPSEILSAGYVGGMYAKEKTVMVVNGFERVSAPASFQSKDSTIAGFNDMLDHGVPYIKDFSYIGSQHEIRREIPWMDDDAPGFGASYADYEDKVIAGNTFDYPYSHGLAFLKQGYNFISSSVGSVINGKVSLNEYDIVDFIMGKQTQTKVGRGVMPVKFEVFPVALREKIKNYTTSGGNILVSGAYVATDLWDSYNVTEEGKNFAKDVLKFRWMTHYASKTGEVKSVSNPYGFSGSFSFYNVPNDKCYVVEAPDAMVPVGKDAYTIFRYSDNNISAGVAYKGDYKSVVLGFPIETLKSQEQIDKIIGEIINFFSTK